MFLPRSVCWRHSRSSKNTYRAEGARPPKRSKSKSTLWRKHALAGSIYVRGSKLLQACPTFRFLHTPVSSRVLAWGCSSGLRSSPRTLSSRRSSRRPGKHGRTVCNASASYDLTALCTAPSLEHQQHTQEYLNHRVPK